MALSRKIGRILAATVLGAAGAFAVAEPASAGAVCPYPYVCFYDRHYVEAGAIITGKFQVVTSYFQPITGTSRYSSSILNTRHDDVAYIRLSTGTIYCVDHASYWNGTWYPGVHDTDNDPLGSYITGVRISSSPTC